MFQLLFVVWWWAYLCFSHLGSTVTIVHTSGLALLVNWTRNRQTVSRSPRAVFNITQNSRGEWHRQTYCTWQLAQQYCRVRAHTCVHVLSDSSPPSCAESWQLKRQKHAITHLSERRGLSTQQQLYHWQSQLQPRLLRLPYCHAPVSVWTLVIKPTQGWNHKILQFSCLLTILKFTWTDWPTIMLCCEIYLTWLVEA